MLISDSSTFFLESVSTGEQSHDAKWIAQDMGRVIDYLADDESPTSKSTANREPTWLSAASSNAMGLLKGVFRKLEKKVNTFCTALFLPGNFIQGTGKQKESRQKINDIITDGKFVELLDKAIMILNPVDTTIVVFSK
ncbi:hypothetical protein BASA81_018005 [Batrachochytrium salamandrivorans]|nr:hypothetical protein BASA81_018005 [Batrachochytrium salamandrivorans]